MKKSIAIIGGGASSLMLAATLDNRKFDVTIFERNFAPGRKFLVAGGGGFNLTHSEDYVQMIERYTPSSFFAPIITSFTNTDLQDWLKHIGIQTYTGSSKRVFPLKGIKPITVLNTFLEILKQKKVILKTQHEWKGWSDDHFLIFDHNGDSIIQKSDITIFALGGASWKITGSDGSWLDYFNKKNIKTSPFQASNCSYEVRWTKKFLELAEGMALKNISLSCNAMKKKGELIITRFGLEGSAIYSLSPAIRDEIRSKGHAIVFLDLKPSATTENLIKKIQNKGNKSLSKQLENELNLNTLQLSLLKFLLTKEEFTDSHTLASKIKQLPIIIINQGPLDEAISTVGGIDLNEIDINFELLKMPDHFVIGEMLNWDAPTGGYLLQGCLSMGFKLATHLNTIYR
jgi:uncharacterized flavoprotein (TIGR03862 family)